MKPLSPLMSLVHGYQMLWLHFFMVYSHQLLVFLFSVSPFLYVSAFNLLPPFLWGHNMELKGFLNSLKKYSWIKLGNLHFLNQVSHILHVSVCFSKNSSFSILAFINLGSPWPYIGRWGTFQSSTTYNYLSSWENGTLTASYLFDNSSSMK